MRMALVVFCMFWSSCVDASKESEAGLGLKTTIDIDSSCGRVIGEDIVGTWKSQFVVYEFRECGIVLPEVTENGYLLGRNLLGGGLLVISGVAEDIETSLELKYLDLDGDRIDEVIAAFSDLDNLTGKIIRISLDSNQNGVVHQFSLQELRLPRVSTDMKTLSATVNLDSTVSWPGGEDGGEGHIVYYDKVGDSLSIRIATAK